MEHFYCIGAPSVSHLFETAHSRRPRILPLKVLLADEMDERAEALGDFLDQMLAGNWRAATVGQALQAVEQAAGIVVFLRDDAALRAAVASVERRIEIAFNFNTLSPSSVTRMGEGEPQLRQTKCAFPFPLFLSFLPVFVGSLAEEI